MQLRIGVLTVSDRAASGQMEDLGGPAVVQALRNEEWTVVKQDVVPDDREQIRETLLSWCGGEGPDVIFTTGGTGLGPRDVTPEATLDIGGRPVPGLAEAIRSAGSAQTPMAMISRGVAVQVGETLIVNLPGNPAGAAEGVEIVRPVLEHAVSTIHGARH